MWHEKTELLSPRSVPEDTPHIVCLCGSTKFYREYQKAYYDETMKGNIVLSVGFYPHSQQESHGQDVGASSDQKIFLDVLHLRKIDIADSIYVLNVGGYIGESAAREIAYAESKGKPIGYLESCGAANDD